MALPFDWRTGAEQPKISRFARRVSLKVHGSIHVTINAMQRRVCVCPVRNIDFWDHGYLTFSSHSAHYLGVLSILNSDSVMWDL